MKPWFAVLSPRLSQGYILETWISFHRWHRRSTGLQRIDAYNKANPWENRTLWRFHEGWTLSHNGCKPSSCEEFLHHRSHHRHHCTSHPLYRPDVALVVSKQPSGNYQGETIFSLDMAYLDSRLITRPDSDWLTPENINAVTEEAESIWYWP